jgi:hypothetical protein
VKATGGDGGRLTRVLAALDRHWFAPASLRDLALVRILAFGTQLLFFRPGLGYGLHLAQADQSLYAPLPLLKLFLLPWGPWGEARPDALFLTVVWGVAVAGGVLATIGLWSRVAMPAAAIANALLVAHQYSYGEFHHPEALMIIALGVLSLAPSGKVWSVDALLRRRERSGRESGDASPSAGSDQSVFARWPLRLMQWLLALTYLSAGTAKLDNGGIAWVNGYTLAYYFAGDGLWQGSALATELAALPPRLWVVPSIGALAFELTFALAILVPRTAWLYVLAGTGMHLAIYAIQRAPFFQTIVLYAVFVESLRLYWPRFLSLNLRDHLALDRLRPGGGRVQQRGDAPA